MQQKFLIPEDTVLQVTDDQGIEVDEDVFPELARKDVCFAISIKDGKMIVHLWVFFYVYVWGGRMHFNSPVSCAFQTSHLPNHSGTQLTAQT